MDSKYYGPIHQSGLQAGMAYYMPEQPTPAPVTLKSPAIEVMTDLNRVGAATITADVPIAIAERSMKVHAVRSLMVIDEARRLLGVITATDLLGEKPLKLSWERGLRRGEITVAATSGLAGSLVCPWATMAARTRSVATARRFRRSTGIIEP